MIGRTGVGILARDANCMFVMMPFMLVVQVTIMQIVGVTLVLNCRMPAIRAMGMVTVVGMVMNFVIIGHGLVLLSDSVSALCAIGLNVSQSGIRFIEPDAYGPTDGQRGGFPCILSLIFPIEV